jgi:GNAT superfamily N-acetyltransferase
MRWERPPLVVDTDTDRLDLGVIHGFLSGSYWAAGIPLEVVQRSVAGSLCFGLYDGDAQVGFARVVTDRATFAYLCDVFVLESRQGQRLGTFLMECVMAHPDLQGLRRFSLATRDAHALYRRFGFGPPRRPESQMEIVDPDVYRRG